MGFTDRFVGDKPGNAPIKVKCTGCDRVTVVKIPSGKSFEKWNSKAKCEQCDATKCWVKLD
jgi:hypothetical protein